MRPHRGADSVDSDPQDTSGTSAATTSEEDVEPVCGDGEINGDEGRDDGLANSDTATCTTFCKLGRVVRSRVSILLRRDGWLSQPVRTVEQGGRTPWLHERKRHD